MRVVGRIVVVAGAAGAVLFPGAGPASAGAKTDLLAGYAVSAPPGTSVDSVFAVPSVDCRATPDSSLFLGSAFRGPGAAIVGLIATCAGGAASYNVGAGRGDVTSSFAGTESVAPGDRIQVLLQDAGNGSYLLSAQGPNTAAIGELVSESDTATLFQGGSTQAVGAPSPAFARVVFHSTVNGAPLAVASPTKSRQAGAHGSNSLSVSPLRSSVFAVVYRPERARRTRRSSAG